MEIARERNHDISEKSFENIFGRVKRRIKVCHKFNETFLKQLLSNCNKSDVERKYSTYKYADWGRLKVREIGFGCHQVAGYSAWPGSITNRSTSQNSPSIPNVMQIFIRNIRHQISIFLFVSFAECREAPSKILTNENNSFIVRPHFIANTFRILFVRIRNHFVAESYRSSCESRVRLV